MQVRDYLGFYDLLAFEILYPLSLGRQICRSPLAPIMVRQAAADLCDHTAANAARSLID